MTIRVVLVFAVVLGLIGCQETGAEPAGPREPGELGGEIGAGTPLPCEIDAILRDKCQTCHAAQPRYGAPMPLVDRDDLVAMAVSDPSVTVGDRVRVRIHDVEAPMPPSNRPQLAPEEIDAIERWLDTGAEPGDGTACAPSDRPVDPGEGVEELPCTPEHVFRAHSSEGATDPFAVSPMPANAGNETLCFNFRSPFVEGEQAIGWAPVVDDDRVLHHYILFSTETEQPENYVGPCHMPNDATFLIGWAPGGGNSMMPDGVGLELPGPNATLILQVHYWNAAGYEDALDSSGVAICTTKTPREQAAGILKLGSVRIDIPPRATNHEVVGTCRSEATARLPQPLTIMASGPHMHRLGRGFEARILRGGDAMRAETFVRVDHWDFQDQGNDMMIGGPQIVMPGDAIETRCIYDNPGDSPVHFGEKTEDEMCLNFVMVYPVDTLPAQRACGLF